LIVLSLLGGGLFGAVVAPRIAAWAHGVDLRTLLLYWFIAIVVHECGHLCGGWLAGLRFNYIRFGPMQIHSSYRLSWHWRGFFSGVTSMLPKSGHRFSRRASLLLWAGGPAASFLPVILVLCQRALWDTRLEILPEFAVISMFIGAGTLIPYRSGLGDSDGKKIWMILTDVERFARLQALFELSAAMETLNDFEDLPDDLVTSAIAIKDDSPETVSAHAIAYCVAFYRPDISRAAQLLETCLASSSHCATLMREALISDAAVFQARKRRRVDLAQEWMNDLPAQPTMPDLRLRAEAGLLEAQGDIPGALAKLDAIEALLQKLPNPRQRHISLRLLSRWKSELSSPVESSLHANA
jgi:hypothetical protein